MQDVGQFVTAVDAEVREGEAMGKVAAVKPTIPFSVLEFIDVRADRRQGCPQREKQAGFPCVAWQP
jgi:hypothetical protein